jgi:hypothetical protein
MRQLPTVTSQAMRGRGTRVFSPPGMTASLTPALALAHLRELSVDVRAAVVVDAAGARLAGDAELADRAGALLEAGGGPAAGVRREVTGGEALLAARGPDGLGIAVLAGSLALVPLLEHDLAAIALELAPPAA